MLRYENMDSLDSYEKSLLLKVEMLKAIENARDAFYEYDNDEVIEILQDFIQDIKLEVKRQS